jgi:hypothetical protein
MRRYSNPVYQGSLLRQMVEMAEKLVKTQVREASAPPQIRRLDRRLSADMIAELVQAYRDGTATTELRRRYDLSQGSVIKILHDHGVAMRRQGLNEQDAATATMLYRSGATEGDPFSGPVAMRLGVGGSWSTVRRIRLG